MDAKQQAGGERGGAGSDKAGRKEVCGRREYGVRASEGAAVTTRGLACVQSVPIYGIN